jgi:lysophospholipase L1-like esterase
MSLALFSVGGCGDATPPTAISLPRAKVSDRAVDAGHHFGRFVAMGTSQTAGMMSGGLFAESQEHAWPAQLARMANVEFTKPLLEEFGCPAPNIAPLELQLRVNGDSRANTTSCSSLQSNVVLPTQNVAIPNVLTSEALFTTPEIATASNVGVGRLYSRILGPGQTQVSAMRDQNPSFVAVEFGAVEVIQTARLGLPTPVVAFAQWTLLYDAVISAVKAEGARAILVSFPNDMADWPGLRSGAELYAERTAFAARYITVSEACGGAEAQNLVYLPRKVFQALSAAGPAKAAGLPTPVITCTNVPNTLDAVLTPAELTIVNAAWMQVNHHIEATAIASGFAHVSLNDLFALPDFRPPFSVEALLTSGEPYGPYMSLDDLHPNASGERLLAVAAAKALNTTYALHIPWQRTIVRR